MLVGNLYQIHKKLQHFESASVMISQKEKEEWRRRADVEDVVALGCFVFFIMVIALSFWGLYEGVLSIFNYTRS